MSRTELVVWQQKQLPSKKKHLLNFAYVVIAAAAIGGLAMLGVFLNLSGGTQSWQAMNRGHQFLPSQGSTNLQKTTERAAPQRASKSSEADRLAAKSLLRQDFGRGKSTEKPVWRRHSKLIPGSPSGNEEDLSVSSDNQSYDSQGKRLEDAIEIVAVAAKEPLEMPSFEELQGWTSEINRQHEQSQGSHSSENANILEHPPKSASLQQADLANLITIVAKPNKRHRDAIIATRAIAGAHDNSVDERITTSNAKDHSDSNDVSKPPSDDLKLSRLPQLASPPAAAPTPTQQVNLPLEDPLEQVVAAIKNIRPPLPDSNVESMLSAKSSHLNAALVDSVAVIVNRRNSETINKQQLRDIYLNRVSHWRNGAEITVYNLPLSSNERELFSRRILNMSALDAATLASNRRITNQQSNAMQTRRHNVVVHYVARNPSAIGYVPLHLARQKDDVRILFTLSGEAH